MGCERRGAGAETASGRDEPARLASPLPELLPHLVHSSCRSSQPSMRWDFFFFWAEKIKKNREPDLLSPPPSFLSPLHPAELRTIPIAKGKKKGGKPNNNNHQPPSTPRSCCPLTCNLPWDGTSRDAAAALEGTGENWGSLLS